MRPPVNALHHGGDAASARPGAAESPRSPDRPRVALQTLGCKLNQYESDAIAAEFAEAGYRIVPFGEEAEVQVLNTCTITNRADRKSRNLLYRSLRSGAKLVVLTGCFAEHHAEEYRREPRGDGVHPGLMVVDNPRKSRIVELVEARRQGDLVDPTALDPALFGFRPASLRHTRAAVKIQDGCDNFCSFCIVPQVRGRAVSRPPAEVLADAEERIREGAKEIVLTGVNISRYERDDTPFSGLLERLLDLPGDFRLRISSLEPDRLDERFRAQLSHPKMTPHLHLCLQSGSDRILREMRRQYDIAQFRRMVDGIREARDDFNLSTDIIVGFPGETEEDFAASREMVRELRFSHVHTFPYSPRSRTRAARMPEQVSNQVKSRRAAEIRRIAGENKHGYRASLIGAQQRVLVERPDPAPEREHGYGEHYVPVRILPPKDSPAPLLERNRFYTVTITGMDPDDEDPEKEPILQGALR